MFVAKRLWPRPNLFIGSEIVPGLTTSFVQKPPARQVSCIDSRDIRKSILVLLVISHRGVVEHRMPEFGHGGNKYNCSAGALSRRKQRKCIHHSGQKRLASGANFNFNSGCKLDDFFYGTKTKITPSIAKNKNKIAPCVSSIRS